jgi:hypothetical protein
LGVGTRRTGGYGQPTAAARRALVGPAREQSVRLQKGSPEHRDIGWWAATAGAGERAVKIGGEKP